MKTLIISSSLSIHSRSYILCQNVAQILLEKKVSVEIVDARKLDLKPYHNIPTESMENLKKKVGECDNIIFGMGVHRYSINDSLKIILDNCLEKVNGKFFGILCAAGGEKSYLSTMHLTQICMNEWRMIQLPRIVYATKKDFKDNNISNNELQERILLFSEDFYTIGKKLVVYSKPSH